MCPVCYDFSLLYFQREEELPTETFWSLDHPSYLAVESKWCFEVTLANIEPIRARLERENPGCLFVL